MTRPQLRTLLGCAVGSLFGYGTLVVVAFALMIPPLMRERGWSHDEIAIVVSIKALVAMAVAPLVGLLIDRFGSRIVIGVSGLAASALLLSLGAATDLSAFYLCYALLIVAASGTMPTSYSHAIVSAFQARRGLAIGIVMAAVGVGAIATPPLLHAAVLTQGVQGGYRLLAILAAVFGLLAALLIAPRAKVAAGPARAGLALALRQAPTPAGRKLLFAAALLGVFTGATWGQLVPLMLGRGVSEDAAAFAMSGLAVAIVFGRLLAGWLLDRLFAPLVSAAFMAPVVAAWILLALGGSGWVAMACAVLVGIGLGAEFDFLSYLAGRYIPTSIYGAFYGLIFSMTSLGAALSSPIFSWWRQQSAGETGALATMAAATLLAIVVLLRLGPYPEHPEPPGVASGRTQRRPQRLGDPATVGKEPTP